MIADRKDELGLPVIVHPVDGDLPTVRNGWTCPKEGRQKGEEKEQRGDGFLHHDFYIGQMLGTVKVGSKLHARPVQSSGRIG